MREKRIKSPKTFAFDTPTNSTHLSSCLPCSTSLQFRGKVAKFDQSLTKLRLRSTHSNAVDRLNKHHGNESVTSLERHRLTTRSLSFTTAIKFTTLIFILF